jgi:predicted nucleic acid-binding protein
VIDERVLEGAWEVQERSGLAFWDALIVAAARSAGCQVLLSEDLQDGQDLGGIVVVDPFRRDPASIP